MKPLAHPEDVRELADEERRRVVRGLIEVFADPRAGKVLTPRTDYHRFRAGLEGLRSYPVPGTYEHELRIVYRIGDDDDVEIVAIGYRRASAVYQLAAKRIAPPPRPRMRR